MTSFSLALLPRADSGAVYEVISFSIIYLVNSKQGATRNMSANYATTPSSWQQAIAQVLAASEQQPLKVVFLTRALKALVKLSQASNLVEVTAASSDYELLLQALSSPEAIELLTQSDPLATAKLRGLQLKQQLMKAEGGCLSSAEAAQMLEISRQAIDKRRRQGKLIGITQGKGRYLYPAWQFTKSGSTLAGLETVLAQLQSFDPWMQLAFMLDPNERLGKQTPLAFLRKGEIDQAVEAAWALAKDETD